MIKVFLLLLVSSLSLYSSARDKAEIEPLDILFIGNSYTHMNDMPKLVQKIARSQGAAINVEMSAKSSHTFEMHSKREEMFRKIKSKDWDYIVLQGFSRELSEAPGYIDSVSLPYIDIILDSIYANNSCTNVLLYMTWGYKNGYKERPEVNTNENMTEAIRLGYEHVAKKRNLSIVPVGLVWKNFRASNEAIELYYTDDAHPSKYGSYMIASSFYIALYKRMPIEPYTGSIKKQEAQLMQQSAYEYITNTMEYYDLLKNSFTVLPVEGTEKKNELAFEANYPQASSITWDFGDGNTSDTTFVVHRYKRQKDYVVTLKVQDACGQRKYSRIVHLANKKCILFNRRREIEFESDEATVK